MYQALLGSPSPRDNPSLPEGGREEGRSLVDQSVVSGQWLASQSSISCQWLVGLSQSRPANHQPVVNSPKPVIVQTSFIQISQFLIGLESLVSQPITSQPVSCQSLNRLSVSQSSVPVSQSVSSQPRCQCSQVSEHRESISRLVSQSVVNQLAVSLEVSIYKS